MSISALLSEAFCKYELDIPSDVCTYVKTFLKKEVHLCCQRCSLDLLVFDVIKPFVKDVPASYKVYYGNVFSSFGMLTRSYDEAADIYVESEEGTLIVDKTPEIINVCGIPVKNEVIQYEQSNWYKCLYSENDFMYFCSHCFLFRIKRLRRIFEKWKNLSNRGHSPL